MSDPLDDALAAGSANGRTRIRDGSLWQAYGDRRYEILFFSLLFMLVAAPVAASINAPAILIKLLFAFCLLLAVLPNATKRTRIVFIGAILVLITLRLLSERDDVPIHFGPVL